MRQIVIDTETTGLDYKQGHRIIEIGGVEIINRRLTGKHFHRYINPGRRVEKEALAIHGISEEFLADKPAFSEIAQEFYDFIKDAELIAHNAAFDMGFINHELKMCQEPFSRVEKICLIVDTLKIAREKHPGQRNSLDALSKRYDIKHFNRELHGALLDAEILAQVYLVMTGGQTMMFTESQMQTGSRRIKKSSIRAVSVDERPPLTVIAPNEKEQKAHEKFLQTLKKKAEVKCLWLEDE